MLSFDVLYNRLDASLLPFLESVEYVDTIGKEPSTLSVSLSNADGRFTREWACTKGDALSIRFGAATPDPLAISEVSVEAVPRLVTWRASARPATSRAPSGRGGGTPPPSSGALVSDKRSWDSLSQMSLRAIAQRVCDECGLSLRYSAKSNPKIPQVARYNESGYHLLERLARRYGLAVRATASEVQIVARPGTSEAPAQADIEIPGSAIIAMQSTEALPVARLRSVRVDPRTGKPVRVSIGDADGGVVSVGYTMEDAAGIYDEAVLDALAGELTVYPDARYVAGAIVKIAGVGLRVITEMRYTRTGDAETMTIRTRGA